MSLAGLEHGGQGDRDGCGCLLVAERRLVYHLTQWLEQPLVQAVHGCRLSAMEAFGACLAALFALENWTLLLCPCIFQLILAFGCCLWSIAYWIFREILRAPHLVRQWIHVLRGLWKILHIFYVAVNSNPEAFALHSAEWRSVHSRCFWLQLLSARFARWKSTLFL